MPEFSEDDRVQLPTDATLSDRRRPGRSRVNPALVPLLRGDFPPGIASAEGPAMTESAYFAGLAEPEADLASARGLVLGLAISVPLWAGIICGVRALLHLAF